MVFRWHHIVQHPTDIPNTPHYAAISQVFHIILSLIPPRPFLYTWRKPRWVILGALYAEADIVRTTYYIDCTMRQRKKLLFTLSPCSYFLPQLLSQPFIGIFPISSLTILKPLHNHINSGVTPYSLTYQEIDIILHHWYGNCLYIWTKIFLASKSYQEQQQKQPPLSKVTLPHIIVSLLVRHVHYGYTKHYTNRTCTCFSSLSVIFVVNRD